MSIKKTVTAAFISGCLFMCTALAAGAAGKYSGFIDSYPELKKDPDGSGGLIYRKPGVDLGSYDKIMIEPIEVWMADDSKYKGFSPDDLKEITDELYRGLLTHLEPDYPVVSQPGEGVLLLRLAITDVYAKKKKRGVVGYIPIGAVVGAATGAYRKVRLKDATIEAELVDPQSGEQLGVLVDRLSISKGADGDDDKTSWDEISKALDFYAKRFRARLDAERAD